jgi:hypothetical protein
MISEWFYEQSGKQIGPVTSTDLKALAASRKLAPANLVWKEGMEQWVRADTLRGLFDGRAAQPAQKAVAAAPGVMANSAGNLPRDPGVLSPASGEPIALEYSSGGRLAPAAKPQLADDRGPVRRISKSFSYRGHGWMGPVLISPVALYLIKSCKQGNVGAAALGGVAGAMISSAVTTSDDVRTCTARELPVRVQGMLKLVHLKSADAIVLPLTAVSFVAPGPNFHVTCGGEDFKFRAGAFGKSKACNAMTKMGWVLNQTLQPTSLPIHGEGLGRNGPMDQPKTMSTFARVMLITGAVVLIILVILAQVLRQMK